MPLAGHDPGYRKPTKQSIISTPMPLAGHDHQHEVQYWRQFHFYSHAPRGAWRGLNTLGWLQYDFYSHAPRGAWLDRGRLPSLWHISTPMPLAGHDDVLACYHPILPVISTPMPLAGHDQNTTYSVVPLEKISTPMPLAGHDKNLITALTNGIISTPMPLAGHDSLYPYW